MANDRAYGFLFTYHLQQPGDQMADLIKEAVCASLRQASDGRAARTITQAYTWSIPCDEQGTQAWQLLLHFNPRVPVIQTYKQVSLAATNAASSAPGNTTLTMIPRTDEQFRVERNSSSMVKFVADHLQGVTQSLTAVAASAARAAPGTREVFVQWEGFMFEVDIAPALVASSGWGAGDYKANVNQDQIADDLHALLSAQGDVREVAVMYQQTSTQGGYAFIAYVQAPEKPTKARWTALAHLLLDNMSTVYTHPEELYRTYVRGLPDAAMTSAGLPQAKFGDWSTRVVSSNDGTAIDWPPLSMVELPFRLLRLESMLRSTDQTSRQQMKEFFQGLLVERQYAQLTVPTDANALVVRQQQQLAVHSGLNMGTDTNALVVSNPGHQQLAAVRRWIDELAELRQRVALLQREKEALEDKLTTLKQRDGFKVCQCQLADEVAEKADADLTTAELQAKVAQLQRKFDAKIALCDELVAEMAKAKDENHEQSARLEGADGRYNELWHKFKTLKESQTGGHKDDDEDGVLALNLARQLDDVQVQFDKLKKQYEKLKSSCECGALDDADDGKDKHIDKKQKVAGSVSD
jgi:hypothetical protein